MTARHLGRMLAAATDSMQFRITEEGADPRLVEVAGKTALVGRSVDCDIVLGQRTVSGRHLRILEGLVVEDLGSRNGTFLDDRAIDGPQVLVGRRLTVGGPASVIEVVHTEGSPQAMLDAEVRRLWQRVDAAERAAKEAKRVMPTRKAAEDGESSLLLDLITHDANSFQPRFTGSVSEFYTLESFRLIRNVETVVTRLAGELTSRLGLNTVLPDGEDGQNLRAILGDLVVTPDVRELREELLEYNQRLLQWLFLAYNTYKTASFELVKEIREALRPVVLRKRGPIPKLYELTKLEDLVYWRRAQEYLEDLSPNYVLDRLDALARESAKGLLKDIDSDGA